MHCGWVVKVEKIRPHENADRLQIATFFGNDTVVDLNTKVGDVGIYFPSDLQLSEEYCEVNNLVRKKDAEGKEIGGYLDPEKRNIKAIKLRGEKSDGIFMPIHSLNYCFADPEKEISIVAGQAADKLNVGDTITIVNGHEICKKYIPKRQNRSGSYSNGNRTRKTKVPYAPLFAEHADTEQLPYNVGAFKEGDEVEITLKMHGTSQRTAYLPVLKGYKKTFLDKLFKREGTPIYDYGYVCGTRRVVLEDFDGKNSFYGSNEFREQHHNKFIGKLMQGETVYYEVVGFTHTGAPIMATGSNEKLGKDFIKVYGKETTFSYGCDPEGKSTSALKGTDEYGDWVLPLPGCQSDLYVYRMTLTTPEGYVVEYTPDYMRYRCEQMGVKTVPVFGKGMLSDDRLHFRDTNGKDHDYLRKPDEQLGDIVIRCAEEYYFGPDPVGKTHTREGVVVRILNRPHFVAYKMKNFEFKVIEGLVKDVSDAPDMEEAQEVIEVETK